MKIYIIRGEASPAAREINYLVKQLESVRTRGVHLVDADSREGIAICELYDVLQRPSVVVTDDDGKEIQSWHGQIPAVPDVRFWAAP